MLEGVQLCAEVARNKSVDVNMQMNRVWPVSMVSYFDEKGSFDAKNGWQDPYHYPAGPVLDGLERLWWKHNSHGNAKRRWFNPVIHRFSHRGSGD
jgi:hypothetical protein